MQSTSCELDESDELPRASRADASCSVSAFEVEVPIVGDVTTKTECLQHHTLHGRADIIHCPSRQLPSTDILRNTRESWPG